MTITTAKTNDDRTIETSRSQSMSSAAVVPGHPGHRGELVKIATRGRDHPTGHVLPTPQLVDPGGQGGARLTPFIGGQSEPAVDPVGDRLDGAGLGRKGQERREVGPDRL